MTIDEKFEMLCGVLGEDVATLIVKGFGYSVETMEKALYAATGLQDFDQLVEEE